jgi:hypothetical protein
VKFFYRARLNVNQPEGVIDLPCRTALCCAIPALLEAFFHESGTKDAS